MIPVEDSKYAAQLALEMDKLLESIFSLLYLVETEAALSEKGRLCANRVREEAHRVALSANPRRKRLPDGLPSTLSSKLQRVLCVDDEPFSLARRQAILEYKGCVVSTATSVADAMEMFRSREFDLVVTNCLVDEQTGTSMSREMKHLKPQVPVIVLSGATPATDDLETADAFISRSELPESLLAKVEELAFRSRNMAIGDDLTKKEKSTRKAQLLAGIVESSNDAIYSKTLAGIVLTWNKAAECMYGYRAEEIIGKSVTLLQLPDHQGEVQGILLRVASGEKVEAFETVRIAKDGHPISVSMNISPILNHVGRIVGASTIARAVSPSKLAAKSLGMAAVRMAATVAHEIRNPLESSTNALFLLAKSASLDDDARRFLTIAQDELADIRQISAATLDLLRVDTQCSPQPVRVSGLVENLLTLYGRKLRTRGIEVETRYETNLTVDAFPGELRQVFSNIVMNAADALEKTGGKLCIHLAESFDFTNPTQRGLRATISDTGPGISAEERKQIFDPFYTTKGKKDGGIGLWLCLDIVQKYGGKIRVRSTVKPGHSGTTFCIFLPTTACPLEIAKAAA